MAARSATLENRNVGDAHFKIYAYIAGRSLRGMESRPMNDESIARWHKASESPEETIDAPADLRTLADAHEALRREHQQLLDTRAEWLSHLSHELRVPLTAIRGYADLIRQQAVGPVTVQQVDFLDTIMNNVDRMAN
jgi:signal transduction histidine kinase